MNTCARHFSPQPCVCCAGEALGAKDRANGIRARGALHVVVPLALRALDTPTARDSARARTAGAWQQGKRRRAAAP